MEATEGGTGTLTFTDAQQRNVQLRDRRGQSDQEHHARSVRPAADLHLGRRSRTSRPRPTIRTCGGASPADSESGWGINLNHEGDTIFATWFTYDLDGAPLWLVVTANKTAPNVFSGDLLRTTGPAFNVQPFDPSKVASTKVGTVTFTFADGNNATFDYSVQLAGMMTPAAQSKAITREIFAAPGTACQ